jgi:hypothetical protein
MLPVWEDVLGQVDQFTCLDFDCIVVILDIVSRLEATMVEVLIMVVGYLISQLREIMLAPTCVWYRPG